MSGRLPLGIKIALSTIPDPSARDVLLNSYRRLREQDWDDVYTVSIREAKNEKYVGKAVKIHATISVISDPQPKELIPDRRRITTVSLQLADLDNYTLDCREIPYEKFKNKIQRFYDRKSFFIFKGTILSVIDYSSTVRQRYYIFYLDDIEERITAQDLIRLKPDASQKVSNTFQRWASTSGGIFNLIKDRLVKGLRIKGLNKARQLDKCIDFMIYQSMSQGIYKNNSMKLHSLIIGAPGEGKKLLVKIAQILNPVFREASPVKVTLAGLIGNFEWGGRGAKSNPGDLPRASGGIFCIQDFHEVTKNRLQIQETFTQVMEDGVAIDSTAARTRHEAVASIHLDQNRQSQVNPSGRFNSFTDINIRTNLLSRFDFIIDIPPDQDRQFEVALSMLKNVGEMEATEEFSLPPKWQRRLQVIVAYIRTYFRFTKPSRETEKYIQERLKQFIQGDDRYNNIPDGMMTRLAVSILKYAMAISAANLRTSVWEEDIDVAFEFIEEKLNFLTTINPGDVVESDAQPDAPSPEHRREFVKAQLKDQIVSPADLHDFITENYPHPVDKKTISRDLKKIGERKAHGKWQIL